MSTTVIDRQVRVAFELIDVGQNVRDLDQKHVDALAGSIALRGLIVPLPVRPIGNRFKLIAGHHRYAACKKLGVSEVEVTLRAKDGSTADSAAENVVRKQLSPLEEARAVRQMLDEHYTLDGAASALGWSRALVSARAKILELPETAQQVIGAGLLPVGMVETLLSIKEVSPQVCEQAAAAILDDTVDGDSFARKPCWAITDAIRRGKSKLFVAFLSRAGSRELAELRLGKKAQAAYEQLRELSKELDRYSYGPPEVHFGELEVDQARAARVLIEFNGEAPLITDRALYRELAKQAIARTLEEAQAAKAAREAEKAKRQRKGKAQSTPEQTLAAEHRASVREFTRRAHNVNLDLGAHLRQKLATVDPGEINVARFFAYGLLGSEHGSYAARRDPAVQVIAANGIRLVFDAHRKTTTPILKTGKRGKTKVAYGETQEAVKWLWGFIDAAKTAGELYGRTLTVYACEHYAQQLVLAKSQRRSSVLPESHKDQARKAFLALTKDLLPGTHVQLARAIAREAKEHEQRERKLAEADRPRRASAHEAESDAASAEADSEAESAEDDERQAA